MGNGFQEAFTQSQLGQGRGRKTLHTRLCVSEKGAICNSQKCSPCCVLVVLYPVFCACNVEKLHPIKRCKPCTYKTEQLISLFHKSDRDLFSAFFFVLFFSVNAL